MIIYTIINQSSIHQSNIDIHFHTSDYTIRLIILHLYHIHHHQSKIGVQFHTSDYTIPSLFSFIRLIYIYIYIYVWLYSFNTILTIYTIINQSSIHQSNIGVHFHTSDYTIPSSFNLICLIYIYVWLYYLNSIYTIIHQINIHQSNTSILFHIICTIINQSIPISHWIIIQFHMSNYTTLIPFLPFLPSSNIHQSNIGVDFITLDYTIPSSFNFICLMCIRLIILFIAFIAFIPFIPSSNIHQSNIGVHFHIICTIINQSHTPNSYIYTIINHSIPISHLSI